MLKIFQMESLHLTGINLDGDGVNALANCIRNVDNLTIVCRLDNHTTVEGIQAISNEILKRDKPVSAVYCILKTKDHSHFIRKSVSSWGCNQ